MQAPVGTPAKPAKSKKQWKIVRAAKIRSGFEQTSTDMGVANIGDIIEEIESRVNARGVTRVHYDRGWLSVKAADGGTILQPVHVPAPAPAPAAAAASDVSPTKPRKITARISGIETREEAPVPNRDKATVCHARPNLCRCTILSNDRAYRAPSRRRTRPSSCR